MRFERKWIAVRAFIAEISFCNYMCFSFMISRSPDRHISRYPDNEGKEYPYVRIYVRNINWRSYVWILILLPFYPLKIGFHSDEIRVEIASVCITLSMWLTPHYAWLILLRFQCRISTRDFVYTNNTVNWIPSLRNVDVMHWG